ncbi:hypothetical protein [Saccharibacillus alkalitolerans]|uniref:Uncharacterized protein n=1 Tax=Saccharibacillus alkalitolerans TaxID=2705290 RepID=A0ABX0F7M8_9BACL|nr:hypothetical protein [Saccharibacillus alkalitolerans]NGZ76958.1 hypothetical protein [Saccharibacillus alkalitolerans]
MNGIVEFKLRLPFYDLIAEPEAENAPAYLEQLAERLRLRIDLSMLEDEYGSCGSGPEQAGCGDLLLFRRTGDPDCFVLIDLFRDFTDQHGMVELGIRCGRELRQPIVELLAALRSQAEPVGEIRESEGGGPRQEIGKKDFSQEIRYGDRVYERRVRIYEQ